MDDHVRLVVGALLEQAGPGGLHERTLLLVSGDHGQTLGGDHGGGSPEEVDSALVAVDLRALRAAKLAQQQHQRGGGGSGAAAALTALAGGGGLGAPASCRANCTCGVEGNQCAPDLLQLDLTPTLAAMLGVPYPYGNLGQLSSELWQLTAAHMPGADMQPPAEVAAAWERSLAAALLANAQQVHRYLHTYAATAGASFSRASLEGLDRLFKAASFEPAASVADAAARRVRMFRARQSTAQATACSAPFFLHVQVLYLSARRSSCGA